MSTLRVGIATYEQMKARTMAIARGQVKRSSDEPRVWFTSIESFAKVLSRSNQDLLRLIRDRNPHSLDELAEMSRRKKSNLSRTLKTMESYGIIQLQQGERRKLIPKVLYDHITLDVALGEAAEHPGQERTPA